MIKRGKILAIFLATVVLCMVNNADAFKGNPAVCAYYHDTSITGSRGLNVYDSIDVFARSMNDKLLHKHYTPIRGWSNWEYLQGSSAIMASSPAVAQFSSNNIWVTFIADVPFYDSRLPIRPTYLCMMNWDGNSWREANYGNLPNGGNLRDESPAITSGHSDLDIFVTGSDGKLYHKAFPTNFYGDWDDLGMPSSGPLTSGPAAGSVSDGRITVVARGQGNAYWYKSFDNGVWHNWELLLGGIFNSAPCVSTVPMFRGGSEQPNGGIAGRGMDNMIYLRGLGCNPCPDAFNCDPNRWCAQSGRAASAPAFINYIGDHITIFYRGFDNSLYYIDMDLHPGTFTAYAWQQVPLPFEPARVVIVDDTTSGSSSESSVRPAPTPSIVVTPQANPRPLEQNKDRPGSDLGPGISVSSAEECQQRCYDNNECQAFTYVRPGAQGNDRALCYLKNAVPNAVDNTCCISGIKYAHIVGT